MHGTKHFTKRNNNKILQALPPNICSSEETPPPLPRHMRRTLAQLKTDTSPFLKSYLHNIGAHPSPLCPLLQNADEHTYNTTPLNSNTHVL